MNEIEEWEDNQWGLMDILDDIWGKLDWLDVLETLYITASTPVSANASHGRFDLEFVAFPRGDKFKIESTAAEAVRLMRRAGIVCGCIGFGSHYTYWLIRRSQLKWAMYMLNNQPGGPLRRPKRLWKDKPGKSLWSRLWE